MIKYILGLFFLFIILVLVFKLHGYYFTIGVVKAIEEKLLRKRRLK